MLPVLPVIQIHILSYLLSFLNMSIIVRPIEALLSHDTELFSKMVLTAPI
jgi:hypothetical protein